MRNLVGFLQYDLNAVFVEWLCAQDFIIIKNDKQDAFSIRLRGNNIHTVVETSSCRILRSEHKTTILLSCS